jgi:hypothetical protein
VLSEDRRERVVVALAQARQQFRFIHGGRTVAGGGRAWASNLTIGDSRRSRAATPGT